MDPLYISIDFDGTLVEHEYPNVGNPVPGAKETMLAMQEAGHKLILYTMRSGKQLQEAIQYVESLGVDLYSVNSNPSQLSWTTSPKVYSHYVIDDNTIGCPLTYRFDRRPYVDWRQVRKLLEAKGIIDEQPREQTEASSKKRIKFKRKV